MSELARRQLTELADASGGAIGLLSERLGEAGRATFTVSLDTSGIPTSGGGIHVRARERFEITVDESFPFVHPSVEVAHRRWAGTPHVQWGAHLCMYAAPTVEWSPADGMRGLISRLNLWLQRAAAGELDPDRQPLHPPIAYASYENGWVVVRPDLGNLAPWSEPGNVRTRLVYAWCAKRGSRIDVLEWLTEETAIQRLLAGDLCAHDEHGQVLFAAPLVLVSDTLDMEYPGSAEKLATALDERGCPRDEMLRAIVNARRFNKLIGAVLDGDKAVPAMMLLGTPARRVEPGRPLTHITAWHLDDLGTRITSLLVRVDPTEQAELAADVRALAHDWIGFANVRWMVVHEARPEVSHRRDSGSPTEWLSGKKVLVLGAGALGAPIAEQCVRAGAAQLHIVDKGNVTPGILVRQPYDDVDIGYGKAKILAQRLSRIRRDVSVTHNHADVVITTLADPEPLFAYDLIVDATADIGVRTRLETVRAAVRDQWPTTITALFGHTAQRGVAAIALRGATGSGHDILRRLAIDTATSPPPGWEAVAEDLFPDPPRTKLFFPEPGCSAPTFTGSATDVTALASTLFAAALAAVSTPEGPQMAALGCDLTPGITGVRPMPLAWQDDFVQPDQTGEYEVRLSARALTEIRTEVRRGHRVRGAAVETGGMLLGSVDEATRTVYIDTANGPSPDSLLSAAYFDHGTQGTQEIIASIHKSTAGRIGFVGMWHTHPYGRAWPSPTDEAGMADIVAPDGTGRRATMLILGGDTTTWRRWIDDGTPPDIYARVVSRAAARRPDDAKTAPFLDPAVAWFPGGYSYRALLGGHL